MTCTRYDCGPEGANSAIPENFNMKRVVLPEYLDSLPPDDPGARANRRELRLFNAFLGTKSWFRRELLNRLQPADRVLEIGAGEGLVIDHLARRLQRHKDPGVSWTALDAQPVFSGHPSIEFVMDDLLQYKDYPQSRVVFGNMILHQFGEDELKRLGEIWHRHARLLVFQEPARSRLHHALCGLSTLPMSQVSRHDASVSIRGGFRGEELPDLLGLPVQDWVWKVRSTLRGAYRMIASRK
jgi:hypothetical protein